MSTLNGCQKRTFIIKIHIERQSYISHISYITSNRTINMQFSTATLFFIGTIASFATNTEAQLFGNLINRLLSPLVSSGCEVAQDALNLTAAECDCALTYGGLFRGFTGGVDCVTTAPQCLQPPDEFCASGNITFDLAAGLFVETGLKSNITACFKVNETSIPGGELLVGGIGDICAEFSTAGLELDECSITIGTEACDICTVCPSGTAFLFDCSNIDLEKNVPLITIPGPKTETCIGLA